MKAVFKEGLKQAWRYGISFLALGAFLAIYQETHAFRDDISVANWFILTFVAVTLVSATETIIAHGIAKGIAQAKAEEQKALSPPGPVKPIEGEGVWADMKREYRKASAQQPK